MEAALLPAQLETLLIVDDEPLMTDLFRHVMTRYGFRVLTAASGREALALVEAEAGATLDAGTREGTLSEGQVTLERFSPREELVALADEWIAATNDEQEKKALRATKEELLAALDKIETQFIPPTQWEMTPGGSRALGVGNELPC